MAWKWVYPTGTLKAKHSASENTYAIAHVNPLLATPTAAVEQFNKILAVGNKVVRVDENTRLSITQKAEEED